jgi:hypothetical protein
MVILRRVYTVPKPHELGAFVDGVAEAFAAVGEPDARVDFVLLDSPFNAHSPIDRLIKAYPAFAPFVIAGEGNVPALVRARVLTSLLPATAGLAPIPVAVVREAARGIPRRFAFRSGNFVWKTPRLGDELQGPPSERLAQALAVPGILVHPLGSVTVSYHAFPGSAKKITLTATVSSDEDVKTSSQLAAPARELLDALGPKGKDTVQPLFDATQQAALREQADAFAPAFERGKTAFAARVAELRLAPLAPDAPATGMNFRVAEEVRDALRPLGYKPAKSSGHGTVTVMKMRSDWTLSVFVDRGTWSQNFMAIWILTRPGFRRRIMLPLAADGRTVTKQVSDENIHAICANLATVVATAEDAVFAELQPA